MNNFGQNRYNVRYRQNVQWNQNKWPHGHSMLRNHHFNTTRSFHSLHGSEKYWCESCDKGFMTKILLNYHIQRHQKCNIDGCQFVAHPKIITRHIQMQHATGLYKRIGKLNNPEEIKKWREERKRKYPTKENIEKKRAEMKEKISRGEKMGLKGDMHGMKRAGVNYKSGFQNKGQKRQASRHCVRIINNRRIIRPQLPAKTKPDTKIFTMELPKEETRKLQPFKGIQDLVIDDNVEDEIPETCNYLIQDDEDISDKEQNDMTNVKPALCGALTSLISNYESSDDEDIEEVSKNITTKTANSDSGTNTVTKLQVKQTKEHPIDNKASNVISNAASDNDSGPEEVKTNKELPEGGSKEEPSSILNSDRKTRKERNERLKKLEIAKRKSKTINLKRKLPSTLLQKLLHSEIKQERNIILQCVRYVVQNNYFEK